MTFQTEMWHPNGEEGGRERGRAGEIFMEGWKERGRR